MFVISAGTAAGIALVLLLLDAKNGVILNASAAVLAQRRAEKEKSQEPSGAFSFQNNKFTFTDVVRVYSSKYTSVRPVIRPRGNAALRNDYLSRLGLPPKPSGANV